MRRLTDDRGTVAPLTAIVIVVLIAIVGLAVDVGAMVWERRQLQNGADAAVLAVAEDCALGVVPCTQTYAQTTAEAFAADNAGDGTAAVEALELTEGTVSVVTRTLNADGSSVLSPIFAQVVGFEGTTVRAQASASWGAVGSMTTLPLIISECEWERITDYGNNLHDPEDLPPAEAEPTVLIFHSDSEECNLSTSGFDLPGGFGWLRTNGTKCSALIRHDNWVFDDPGASPSNGCSPAKFESLLGHTVLLPWFNELTGTGDSGQYHVNDFAAFYVTGYNFGGQFKEPAGNLPCTGNQRCLAGYFTVGATTGGEIGGGEDRGARAVQLTS